jgi:hypothetical protein
MKLLHAPRVKPEIGSPRRIKSAQAMGVKVVINISGAKVGGGLKMTRIT